METTTKKTALEPFADQVIVQPIEETNVTEGGIHLPTSSQQRPTRGRVVAVGPGRRAPDTGARIEPDVQVGQTVIYSRYAGTDVKVDGEELVILKEKDCLCVVHEPI